jgi:hypothetical protein
MTWIIIIVLVLVVFFLVANQKHNSEVEKFHIDRGGFRKSFSVLSNFLENDLSMQLFSDTGRSFSYSKNINEKGYSGKLIIGVKLDLKDEPILFSKFKKANGEEFSGVDITAVNYNSIEVIIDCIKISTRSFEKFGFSIEDNSSQQIIEDWNTLNKEFSKTPLGPELELFIKYSFIPNGISPLLTMQNFDILRNPWKRMGIDTEDYGTESIAGIDYVPPGFSNLFIAAYPDVYKWYQVNASSGKIEIHNKIEKLDDDEVEEFFSNPVKLFDFYRSLIKQFTSEGNIFETKA